MPQLSLETFIAQYIWFMVFLFIFFMVTSILVIPRISQIYKVRNNLKDDNNMVNVLNSENTIGTTTHTIKELLELEKKIEEIKKNN